MREHRYFVYIMTNCSRPPLYTGVTRSVDRRSAQHKSGFYGRTSYTAKFCHSERSEESWFLFGNYDSESLGG